VIYHVYTVKWLIKAVTNTFDDNSATTKVNVVLIFTKVIINLLNITIYKSLTKKKRRKQLYAWKLTFHNSDPIPVKK
jgi:hypothetical protein